MTRHIRWALMIVVTISAGLFLPGLVSSREMGEEERADAVREVRIVAKDMTYRVEGLDGTNPTLHFTPGQKVRVSLRNEDKGMLHDFGIPEWGVTTGTVEWSTEKTVTFRVPKRKVGTTYVCSPHSAMMSGAIALDR
jgi:hypothetical protein